MNSQRTKIKGDILGHGEISEAHKNLLVAHLDNANAAFVYNWNALVQELIEINVEPATLLGTAKKIYEKIKAIEKVGLVYIHEHLFLLFQEDELAPINRKEINSFKLDVAKGGKIFEAYSSLWIAGSDGTIVSAWEKLKAQLHDVNVQPATFLFIFQSFFGKMEIAVMMDKVNSNKVSLLV
jgi:hypothetical protein